MNRVTAECSVVISNMMLSILEKGTLTASKAFLDEKIRSDRDCVENEAEIRAFFAPALICRTKAAFKACVAELQAEAVRVSAEYSRATRVNRVISRCAEEGLTGVTPAQVEATEAAKGAANFSVMAAITELLNAAEEEPEQARELARYTVYKRDWYVPTETAAEKARYGDRMPGPGESITLKTGLNYGAARQYCGEFNDKIGDGGEYSTKAEFREE